MTSDDQKKNTTDLFAANGFSITTVPADGVMMWASARITDPQQVTHIYIEGDGMAYLTSYQASPDPTPRTPMFAELAIADPAANVIYLSRPCQYTREQSPACTIADWTTERFSHRQVQRLHTTIDYYQQRFHLASLELIGYSGGGAFAATIAATRNDVTGLRTVAGNLDIAAFVKDHDLTPLGDVAEPLSYKNKLAHMPQMHLISRDDRVIPPRLVEGYAAKLNSSVISITTVDGPEHGGDWANAWQAFISKPLR